MSKIIQFSLARNSDPQEAPPTVEALRAEVRAQAVAVEAVAEEWAVRDGPVTFKEFEGALRLVVFSLARAVIMLFLARREAHLMQEFPRQVEREGRHFRAAPAQSRALTTLFGVVRYWRTYFRETGAEDKCGFHPLDQSLGLSGDRFSWSVLSHGVWLALRLSFAEARTALARFIPDAPSTEVVEQSVLGFGRYTEEWFEQQPPPAGDGEVLIMQFDSKGAPTATATELKRRRGPRRRRKPAPSRRHAGRTRRKGYTKKKRRNKGDKSKNAKMATLVVMYTLRREGDLLLGPLNRWHYASFAPKRRAFEVARREADKRGFTRDSGKTVQIVTDGDHDLACYAAQYFPEAKVTIDVMHVIEKLWTAGESLYPEGSRELQEWVELQKERLYGGQVPALSPNCGSAWPPSPRPVPGTKASGNDWRKPCATWRNARPSSTTANCLPKTWRSAAAWSRARSRTSSPSAATTAACAGSRNAPKPSSSFVVSTPTATGMPSATSFTTACRAMLPFMAFANVSNVQPRRHYPPVRRPHA